MKVSSASRLEVDPARRPGFVQLVNPWCVLLDDGRWLRVPAGFWCDGASIPPLSRAWLHPLTLLAMGVAHDFAVRAGALIYREGRDPEPFTVETATDLAVALAEHAGAGRFKRWLIATALRWAAPTYWHQRTMEWQP